MQFLINAVYVLKKLTEENHDRNMHVFNDIVKKRNGSLSEKVSLSITILHCYGHILACQVLSSPKQTEGMG